MQRTKWHNGEELLPTASDLLRYWPAALSQAKPTIWFDFGKGEWNTAFNTPTGHHEYLFMPPGLIDAPVILEMFVNDILRDYLKEFVFL